MYIYVYIFLTLNLLTTTIVAPPSNASKWQMGFNSAFKGLKSFLVDFVCRKVRLYKVKTLHKVANARQKFALYPCLYCIRN